MNYLELKESFQQYLYSNGYRETDIAIHCDTNEKAEIIIQIFSLMGKTWSATAPLLLVNENNRAVTRWNKEKSDTCYRIKETEPQFIAKGNINFYKNRNDVVIVEFLDLFPFLADQLTETASISDEKEVPKKKFGLFSTKKVTNDKSTDISENNSTNNDLSTILVKDIAKDVIDISEEVSTDEKTEEDTLTDEITTNSEQNDTKFKITDIIPQFTKFEVEGLNGRVFMINDLGIREEEKMPDFWVRCDCEWELSYILMHLDKVHYLD